MEAWYRESLGRDAVSLEEIDQVLCLQVMIVPELAEISNLIKFRGNL